jgi:UDP-glucose 4-epimerase
MSRAIASVFGGGGFIGTNLCARLAAAGFKVRAFGRSRLFPEALRDVEWVEGDLSDRAAIARVLEPSTIVYHLIHSVLPAAPSGPHADPRHNVASTLQLLDACQDAGVARVVFVSSGGTVYGNAAEIPTPESAPTAPASPYAASNVAIEQCLAARERQNGLEYRVLRATNPYGPFQTANKKQGVVAAMIRSALQNERFEVWGDGSVIRDFVYVDDVVSALLLAAEDRSSHRVFNIGSGQGRSLLEVIAATERIIGRPLRIDWRPARASDVPVSVVSIERAKHALGWRPSVDFVEGLDRTVSWWRRRLSAGSNAAC